MELRVTVLCENEVRAAMGRITSRSETIMATALLAGGEVVRRKAVDNLRAQGLWRSGTLARSITVQRIG